MKANKLILFKVFFALFLFSFPVFAKDSGNAGYCAKAETTADLVTCAGIRLKAETEQMKVLYDEVEKAYADHPDDIENLKSVQSDWLKLKDRICEMESKFFAGGSLERVQELTCLSNMFAKRNRHFENLLQGFDVKIPVYSQPPRWANVLTHDYEDIFWSFANNRNADLDCDGNDEIVVRGIRVSPESEPQMVLAVAESGDTARPGIKLINFDDTQNCHIRPDLLFTPVPVVKPEGDEKAVGCRYKVKLSTENCGDFRIMLDKDSQSYTLTPETE